MGQTAPLRTFSTRLGPLAARNRLAEALAARQAAGLPVVDLTLTNPTRAGLHYPSELLAPLGDPAGLTYEPSPFGLTAARRAVAADYDRRGWAVPSDRIVLTASTSEAYALIFKLLCGPGDTVLAPRPSYPLLEHLTALEGVALDQYRLEWHGEWTVDLADLERRLVAGGGRVRAIVVISPNNPTGSVATPRELETMGDLARRHDAALIVDEVFADYPLDRRQAGAAPPDDVLSFRLGGLSKSAGLPQVKLGWMAVAGSDGEVAEALERLEIICDAYLSVSTPVQHAAERLIAAGGGIRRQIHDRVTANLAVLRAAARLHPAVTVLPVDAGWQAVVQVPATAPEDDLVVGLLNADGILVHPGYFFDFEREAFLIVSLLPDPATFGPAVDRVLARLGGGA